MKYLVLTQPSEAYAESISASIHALGRPAEVRSDSDVSKRYCGWIVHPTTGDVALCLPEGDTHRIHQLADVETFCGLIGNPDVAVMVAAEDGTESLQGMTMSEHLNASRGGRGSILELLETTIFTNNLLTKEQAEANGWFATEEIL